MTRAPGCALAVLPAIAVSPAFAVSRALAVSLAIAGLATVAGAQTHPVPNPLTIDAAIELARAVHPDLAVARAGLSIERADSTVAGTHAFNPELHLALSRGGSSFGSGAEGSVEFELRQEIELWGKRGQRKELAAARTRTAAAELEAHEQAIALAVRAAFRRALFLQDRLDLLTELAELDRRVVASAQARVRDGTMTPFTGRLTELDYLRVDTERRAGASALRQGMIRLGLAVGAELPDTLRLAGGIQVDSVTISESTAIAAALAARREGDVLRRRVDERRAELELAEREGKPNVTLGAGLLWEKTELSGEDFSGDPAIVGGIAGVTDRDRLWRAGVSVPLPFWQRNQVARARAAGEVARAQAQSDRFGVTTRLEVLAALRRFQDAAALHRIYRERSPRIRDDLVLVQKAYADGRISLDSYLTEKGKLVETLRDQILAGDAYEEARAALEAATGMDLEQLNGGGDR